MKVWIEVDGKEKEGLGLDFAKASDEQIRSEMLRVADLLIEKKWARAKAANKPASA